MDGEYLILLICSLLICAICCSSTIMFGGMFFNNNAMVTRIDVYRPAYQSTFRPISPAIIQPIILQPQQNAASCNNPAIKLSLPQVLMTLAGGCYFVTDAFKNNQFAALCDYTGTPVLLSSVGQYYYLVCVMQTSTNIGIEGDLGLMHTATHSHDPFNENSQIGDIYYPIYYYPKNENLTDTNKKQLTCANFNSLVNDKTLSGPTKQLFGSIILDPPLSTL